MEKNGSNKQRLVDYSLTIKLPETILDNFIIFRNLINDSRETSDTSLDYLRVRGGREGGRGGEEGREGGSEGERESITYM